MYEDTELVARITQVDSLLTNEFSQWYAEIMRNFNVVAGYLYTSEDLQKLNSEGRYALVYNILLPKILQLVGNFKYNQMGIEAQPRDFTDAKKAKIITDTINYVHQQVNDANYEIGKALSHAAIGRIGWIKHDMIINEQGYPDIKITYCDPFSIAFDTTFTRRDCSDMKFVRQAKWLRLDDILNTFAYDNSELYDTILEKANGLVSSLNSKGSIVSYIQRTFGAILDYVSNKKSQDMNTDWNLEKIHEYYMSNKELFKVIEWHERRTERRFVVYDAVKNVTVDISKEIDYDGKTWSEPKLAQVKAKFEYEPVTRQEIRKLIYQTVVIPALNICVYDEPYEVQNGQFAFTPLMAYDFHTNTMEIKSVIDNVKDIAIAYNKKKNTENEQIMRSIKNGWMVEEDTLVDEDELTSNRLAPIIHVKKGRGGGIEPIDNSQVSNSIMALAQDDMALVDVITGIGKNAMGIQEESSESGVAIARRVRQSDVMQEVLNDNATFAMLQVAKNTYSYIRKYMTQERILRLEGDDLQDTQVAINQRNIKLENGQVVTEILNDVTVGEYDITISKAPYGREAKDNEFNKLMMLNQGLGTLNPQYIDVITTVKASGSVYAPQMIEHIKQVQQAAQQPQADPEMQKAQMEIQAKQQKMNQDAQMGQLEIQKMLEKMQIDRKLAELKVGQIQQKTYQDIMNQNSRIENARTI